MNPRYFIVYGLLLLLVFFNGALSATERVDAEKSYTNVMPHVHYLEDAEKTLDFERFEAMQEAELHDLKSSAGGFAFSASAYWFRFQVSNTTAVDARRLLAFEPTWLDKIDIQVRTPSGAKVHFRGGDRYAYGTRSFQHPRSVFELDFAPGESVVSVRVETRDPFVVVMELWDERAFFGHDERFSKYIGFFYGVLIAMVIYNFILFTAIRDRMYAFYVAYVVFFLVMNFTYSGYAFPYLWPAYPEWGNWAHSISIYLYTLSGLFFAIIFLNTKERLPRVHRWILIYMLLVVAVFILTALAGGYAYNVATSIFFVVFFSLIAFALGIISWLNGNRTARFYILATTAGLFGAAVTALTVLSILPFTFYTYRAVDIGMIFDAMLLSLALADRYKLVEKERERLQFREEQQRELLEQKERFARELEGRVQEELEKNRQQEKVMLKQYQQAALGNMIGVIAHQLKQPLNAISLYMQDMVESYRYGELTPESVAKMQKSVWERISFMSGTIDEFRNYFRPNKEAKEFFLRDAVDKVLSLLDKQLEEREVRITVEATDSVIMRSYENELQQVILNLVTNALDIFAERRIETPELRIEILRQEENAVIRVEDNGGGIPKDVMGHMFELYYTTKGEAGTGLGLYMSRMIVTESLGGEMRVENSEKGARFTMVLPLD